MALVKIADVESLSWGGDEYKPIEKGKNKGLFEVPNAAVEDLLPHGAILVSSVAPVSGDDAEA